MDTSLQAEVLPQVHPLRSKSSCIPIQFSAMLQLAGTSIASLCPQDHDDNTCCPVVIMGNTNKKVAVYITMCKLVKRWMSSAAGLQA